MGFRTFTEFCEERKIGLPETNVYPSAWFRKNGLPMIVACKSCEMTMGLPSALLDENNNTYCTECAER